MFFQILEFLTFIIIYSYLGQFFFSVCIKPLLYFDEFHTASKSSLNIVFLKENLSFIYKIKNRRDIIINLALKILWPIAMFFIIGYTIGEIIYIHKIKDNVNNLIASYVVEEDKQ